MKKERKHLKLNIKGNLKKFWTTLFLRQKIREMGVDVHDIKDHSSSHVEISVSGEQEKLWKVVRWSKGKDVFMILNEVVFEFADSVPSR